MVGTRAEARGSFPDRKPAALSARLAVRRMAWVRTLFGRSPKIVQIGMQQCSGVTTHRPVAILHVCGSFSDRHFCIARPFRTDATGRSFPVAAGTASEFDGQDGVT